MTDASELRERAERLFALALQAREKGNVALGEQLTALAVECLEALNGPHDKAPPPPPSARVIPQMQQQQQQQQAEPAGDDEDSNSST
jgi:hypothetical protein